MPILEEKALNDLKYNYNYNLGRYYKGCDYCSKHIEQSSKWVPTLVEIKDTMELLIEEIKKYTTVTSDEILKGFKI